MNKNIYKRLTDQQKVLYHLEKPEGGKISSITDFVLLFGGLTIVYMIVELLISIKTGNPLTMPLLESRLYSLLYWFGLLCILLSYVLASIKESKFIQKYEEIGLKNKNYFFYLIIFNTDNNKY